MRTSAALFVILGACALASAQTTTYRVQLTGASQLPAVSTDATATATLSFNEDTQNITYYLDFVNVPMPVASHIHVNAGPSQNGSVGVPLWDAVFAPVPGSGPVTGRVASSTVMPTGFVGPLEKLYPGNNVDVSQLLDQYIRTGKAYVQVHNMQYPKGFIRGNFQESDVVNAAVVPQSAPVETVPQTGGQVLAVLVG